MVRAFERVSEFLQSQIDKGVFPSAQYAVTQGGEVIAEDALGWSVLEPERIQAGPDTLYDLASLTKPLVTALLVALVAQRDGVELEMRVGDCLGEPASDGGGGRTTLLNLLTHTSGLRPWSPLYHETDEPGEVPAAILRLAGRGPDSAEVVYSDLNYVLLGYALERLTGRPLDQLVRERIAEPLGLKRTMFNPPPPLKRETAATERGSVYEAGQARAVDHPRNPGLRLARDPLERAGVIWGEVHDGNAYFMGGAAGHAGLFSTAREVVRLANEFLPGSRLLDDRWLRLFVDNLTPGRDGARSLGWVLASTADCSAGPALPATSMGHTGFTGTSLWIDPEQRRVFVLLTNRIHPVVRADDMRPIRQRFNTLSVEELEAQVSSV